MEHRISNPWSWQDQYGFVQAHEVRDPKRVLFCAGQTSVDAEGRPIHPNDMEAQITQALNNLETVLREAGFRLADVVSLHVYTTDVDRFLQSNAVLASRLAEAGCRHTGTLLGVTRLYIPELLVELQVTAVA